MKKILLVVVALTLFAAQAEEIRLGTLVVTGRDKLGEAAFKLGMMSGNLMLGGLLQGALQDAPKAKQPYAIVFDTETKQSDLKKIEACDKTPKLASGEIMKVSICPKGLAKLCEIDEVAKGMTKKGKQCVDDLTAAVFTLKLDNSGITIDGEIAVKKDSKLISEENPLAADALAFADKTALMAAAVTENSGNDYSLIRKVIAIFERHGVKFDCLKIVGEGGDNFLVIDPTLVKATIEKNVAVCESIDREAIKAELEELKNASEEHAPAGRASLAVKGYECAFTPAERFAATLPEIGDKRIYQAMVISYYSVIRAAIPHIEKMKASAAMLPGESKGAVAYATWDDAATPEKGNIIFRISADEIRSLGMASGVILAAMMSEDNNCPFEEDDED